MAQRHFSFLGDAGVDSLMWLMVSATAALASGSVLRCIGIGHRISRKHMIPKRPTGYIVNKWLDARRSQALLPNVSASRAELLRVPAGRMEAIVGILAAKSQRMAGHGRWMDRQYDPIKLIRALIFSQHLKSPKYFDVALEDARAYEAEGEADVQSVGVGSAGPNPSRSQLEMSRARLDAVCMCIQRRYFHSWQQEDAIDAINIYSDSSPVTGIELQGMLVDYLLNDGTFRRLTLPGSTLAYGLHDWVSKSLALVWSVFLICGPQKESLYYFFRGCEASPQIMGLSSVLACCATSFLPFSIGSVVFRWVMLLTL